MGAMYNEHGVTLKNLTMLLVYLIQGVGDYGETHEMARIPHGIVHMFNNRGYPY